MSGIKSVRVVRKHSRTESAGSVGSAKTRRSQRGFDVTIVSGEIECLNLSVPGLAQMEVAECHECFWPNVVYNTDHCHF